MFDLCTKQWLRPRHHLCNYQKRYICKQRSFLICTSSYANIAILNIIWKTHISILSNKISKYSGILNRLEPYLTLYIMRMLYCSVVNSHLLYGILVYGYVWCHRLKKIQKHIIRLTTVIKYNAHTEPLFKALDILKLKDTLNLNTLKFYYRHQHDNLPAYFYSFQIKRKDLIKTIIHAIVIKSKSIAQQHLILIKESEYISLKWST